MSPRRTGAMHRRVVNMMEAAHRMTVWQMVEEVASRTPEAVAVECGKESLTFGELWAASIEVKAQVCGTAGFTPGDLVATLFTRSVTCVVAQLGVWLAGGAYLPLDPALPRGRISVILADAKPRAVLAQGDLQELLPVDMPLVGAAIGAAPGEVVKHDTSRDSMAYVIYTSGSTGTPKGVAVGHHSLVNLVRWHGRTYGTRPGVRVGALAGLGFDASVWEVWSTLANGATLVLPSDLDPADIHAVSDFLQNDSVEQCFLSTPLAEQLFDLAEPPTSLKVLHTGGDRLRLYPPAEFPAAVFNHYGPTEATVVTTASTDLRSRERIGLPAIGSPIQGAVVRLVDSAGATVSEPGVQGELVIGGAVLALGYLHDAPMTHQFFLREEDGSVWYYSGDICRWTADGDLEFIGRRDTQVSVHGYRIELSEIEHAMLNVAGVEQAVAVVTTEHDGVLVGYFVGAVAEDAIHQALVHQLPRYMLPTVFHRLESMPLNASGKIDRNALPAVLSRTQVAQPDAAETQSTIQRIAQIWAEVLGRNPQVHDDFFRIGGNSIRAARATGQVRKTFDVSIGIRVIFDNPVLSNYAHRLDELMRGEE
ncbi:non-ribosomal peptide synthetase [Streptomyces vinaceus]|nr:non-ribosomal peptide synthetase [Streptomyces vinaceus]